MDTERSGWIQDMFWRELTGLADGLDWGGGDRNGEIKNKP